MKLLHLADLHLGKRLYERSLIEDQRHILAQTVAWAAKARPAAVLIAGDVYDKPVPPAEAVELLDDFLTDMRAVCPQILLIAGNHDSPERLGFGGRMLREQGLWIGPGRAEVAPGLFVHLLPFVRPAQAVGAALAELAVVPDARNILLCHQFVTAAGERPALSDSETVTVGGADNVDAGLFAAYDYVALGHLHRPQSVGRETVRYAGSPIKYSFSEARGDKSLTVLEVGAELSISTVPLRPLREMVELEGRLADILDAATPAEDYVRAILTDAEEPHNALERLRHVYPNLLRIDFRRENEADTAALAAVEGKGPLELFADFYENRHGRALDGEQRAIVGEAWRAMGGDGE